MPVSVAPLIDDDELDPGWLGVLEAVDDDRSIEDICLHTHSSEFFVCDVLFRKANEGKVKFVRPRAIAPEADHSTVVEQETGAKTGPQPETVVDPTSLDGMMAGAAAHLEEEAIDAAAQVFCSWRQVSNRTIPVNGNGSPK